MARRSRRCTQRTSRTHESADRPHRSTGTRIDLTWMITRVTSKAPHRARPPTPVAWQACMCKSRRFASQCHDLPQYRRGGQYALLYRVPRVQRAGELRLLERGLGMVPRRSRPPRWWRRVNGRANRPGVDRPIRRTKQGFRIERAPDVAASGHVVQIAQLARNNTTYSSTGLENGTR